MNKLHSTRLSSRFIALLLSLVCPFLILSFLKCNELNENISTPVDVQVSQTILNSNQIRHINYNDDILTARAFQMIDNIIQPDLTPIEEQNSFELLKIYFMIPSYESLLGLITAFLCFGTLIGMFFVRRFIHHIVIPHSINAPPYILAENI